MSTKNEEMEIACNADENGFIENVEGKAAQHGKDEEVLHVLHWICQKFFLNSLKLSIK